MAALFALFALAALVGLTIWAQRRAYVLQYAFFLRWPLLLAAALVLSPLLGSSDTSPFNLFVLDSPVQLGIVGLLATLAAWVVMYTSLLVWTRLPARVRLHFPKGRRARFVPGSPRLAENPLSSLLLDLRKRLAIFALLAVPLIAACTLQSAFASEIGKALAAAAGIAAAALLIGSAILLRRLAERRDLRISWLLWITDSLRRAFDRIDRVLAGPKPRPDSLNGFESDGTFRHQNAAYFFLVTLGVYVAVGWVARPSLADAAEIPLLPALAFVLLLAILLGWLLPLASFFLDKYRFPAEIALVAFVAVIYLAQGTDYRYATHPLSAGPETAGEIHDLSPKAYVSGLPAGRPIVVVAASGGGITASLWTATVLTKLHEDQELGSGFASATRLISATSGGSVGTMYYVDALGRGVSPAALKAVRDASGRSSLSALGWGLVYPDFLRALVPLPLYGLQDRGRALETRWSRWLAPNLEGDNRTQDAMPRLSSWRERARRHEIPAIAFNAVLVETGERFVLSTLDRLGSEDSQQRGYQRFSDLYPDRDIEIATAARLSATFPWVTPAARPDIENGKAFHVADGGYYDNHGMMVALQFINALLEAEATQPVILVEIRASTSERNPRPLVNAGFYLELFGPAEAMFAVRSASQRARNELELDLLTKRWPGRISRVAFELRKRFPLSWHLTSDDQGKIVGHWDDPRVQKQLHVLLDHWRQLPGY